MNIHGARRAGRRRRKACIGWSWAAAWGVQGRGGAHCAASRTACFGRSAAVRRTTDESKWNCSCNRVTGKRCTLDCKVLYDRPLRRFIAVRACCRSEKCTKAKSRIFLTRSMTAEPVLAGGDLSPAASARAASVKIRFSDCSVVPSIKLRTYRIFTWQHKQQQRYDYDFTAIRRELDCLWKVIKVIVT